MTPRFTLVNHLGQHHSWHWTRSGAARALRLLNSKVEPFTTYYLKER